MDLKSFIIEQILSESGKIIAMRFNSESQFYNNHREIMKEIESSYGVNNSEKVYCILNDISEAPVCFNSECNNKVGFQQFTTGYKKYCSNKCQTNCKSRLKDVKNTKKINHGDENYNNRVKAKNTTLEKYGVESTNVLDNVKEKKRQTNQKKFGVDAPLQNKEILNKMIETNISKYDKKFITQVERVKQKSKETKKKVYGDENYNNVKKAIQTKKQKYGGRPNNSCLQINDYENLYNIDFIKEKFFKDGVFDLDSYLEYFNVSQIVYYKKLKPTYPDLFKTVRFISRKELDLFSKLDFFDKVQSDRKILNGKELDILIPSKNLAIEFNGLYWHSEKMGKDKKYHIGKTEKCLEHGINLVHVFENVWDINNEAVIDKINKMSDISLFDDLTHYEISEIDSNTKKTFLLENGFDKVINSTLNLGLYISSQLVSVITFTKKRDGLLSIANYETKNGLYYKDILSKFISYLKDNYSFTKLEYKLDKCFYDLREINENRFKQTKVLKPKAIDQMFGIEDKVWDVGYEIFELKL